MTTTATRGKRSSRRRSAKMKAAGCVHRDGIGWLHPYSKEGLIQSLLDS